MIKLVFVLLDDTQSKNTINILHFLNNYVNELNKKNYYVEIFPINKDIIDTEKFKKFRESNNVQSIPSVIIMNNNEIKTISDSNKVGSFLENIITNNNNNNNKQNNSDSDCDGESLNGEDIIENYMANEVCSKNFDRGEDILSTGHDEHFLKNKMKEFNSKKNVDYNKSCDDDNQGHVIKKNSENTRNRKQNENMRNNNENNIDSKYSEKLFNKASKKQNIKNIIKNELNNNGDDKLISDKFLNDLDDD
jgi:hypothetical protein